MNDHASELRRFASVLGKPTIMLDAADEIERLAARLEAAEKERDALRVELNEIRYGVAVAHDTIKALRVEIEALRAKITEMEQQNPVGVLHVGSYYGEELQDWEFEANQCACDKLNEAYVSNPTSLPLYALPGAKGASFIDTSQLEGVVSTEIVHSYPPPFGWLRAIDEALVVTHLGVANPDDTYEQAREKLNNLIGWHVDVATDPAVNGGWKLAPIEPTPGMKTAGMGVDVYQDSPPATACLTWKEAEAIYTAMLAAAPEYKP